MENDSKDGTHPDLLEGHHVILILGPGGVGKTTTSLALAVLAAGQGKKVGLISIDPAKRLANAIGIRLGNRLSKVNLINNKNNGELWAAMLDQKAVFDDMVHRYTSDKNREKIYANPIYQSISQHLGGPLEYMALAKLYDMASADFDLVIVDTPPDTHALDFLDKPTILSDFEENRVMSWMIKPFSIAEKMGVFRVFSAGQKLMHGLAKVTGLSMLQKLVEFLVLMETSIGGFHKTGEKIKKILKSSNTAFCLVCTSNPASVRTTQHLMSQLTSMGYPLQAIFFNRTMPLKILKGIKIWENNNKILGSWNKIFKPYQDRQQNDQQMQEKLIEMGKKLGHQKLQLFQIEERSQMIQTVSALEDFSQSIAPFGAQQETAPPSRPL